MVTFSVVYPNNPAYDKHVRQMRFSYDAHPPNK